MTCLKWQFKQTYIFKFFPKKKVIKFYKKKVVIIDGAINLFLVRIIQTYRCMKRKLLAFPKRKKQSSRWAYWGVPQSRPKAYLR